MAPVTPLSAGVVEAAPPGESSAKETGEAAESSYKRLSAVVEHGLQLEEEEAKGVGR